MNKGNLIANASSVGKLGISKEIAERDLIREGEEEDLRLVIETTREEGDMTRGQEEDHHQEVAQDQDLVHIKE